MPLPEIRFTNPFLGISRELTPEKSREMARRYDTRRADAEPLFANAGLLSPMDAEYYIRSAERMAEAYERTIRKHYRFALHCRYWYGRRMGSAAVDSVDSRFGPQKIPATPTFYADVWRRKLGDLCGRDGTYRKENRSAA